MKSLSPAERALLQDMIIREAMPEEEHDAHLDELNPSEGEIAELLVVRGCAIWVYQCDEEHEWEALIATDLGRLALRICAQEAA